MKKFFKLSLLLTTMFLVSKCGKNSINDSEERQIEVTASQVVNKANLACNLSYPDQSLLWLSDIIRKAEEDKQTRKYLGNYMGKIFQTSYHNKPVFYIKMMLGSGALYGYIYDCFGDNVTISENDIITFDQNAQKATLIYSNIPF